MTVDSVDERSRYSHQFESPGVDSFRIYLEEIGRHSLLDKEGEIALAKAIESGREAFERLVGTSGEEVDLSSHERRELRRRVHDGEKAKERFTTANLRLVVSIAKSFQRSGVDLGDLVQEGNLGLLRAVENFDWRRGYRFSTFATWWIKKAVIQASTESRSVIHLPRLRRRQAALLAEVAENLERRLGRRASLGELAATSGIPLRDVAAVLRASARVGSLSAPIDDSGEEISSLLVDPHDDPSDVAISQLGDGALDYLVEGLSPGAARVMRLRYGFGTAQPKSVAEVANEIGISPERVRQVESRSLALLRNRITPSVFC